MKVLMIPNLASFDNHESGIKRVIEEYTTRAKDYGIEIVDREINDESSYDLVAIHAGANSKYPKQKPIVSHLHGLYWTSDYKASRWEWDVNGAVIETARRATVITVPSEWVAECIRRDMRINPVVIPHGINVDKWKNRQKNEGYVLWNKNRNMDVCTPEPIGHLAVDNPDIEFITTFPPRDFDVSNIITIGIQSSEVMKSYIQRAGVYLSTTKETFGIGVLEALASGIPVLGFNHGGNKMLVEHGVSGYLAPPNDYDDLSKGLKFCLENRNILSKNAVKTAERWTWDNSMKLLRYSYDLALDRWESWKRQKYIDKEMYLVS